MYELRTIDVWDTLLRRDCHPECVKLATAYHLLLGWSDRLKAGFREQWALYHARLDAERRLAEASRAEGGDGEYEIVEVLRVWLDVVTDGSTNRSLADELANFELQVEIARSHKDPEIESFLERYPAKRSRFLSDFYMSADMLARLLESKGLAALLEGGLSSCDIGRNKRSGRLFQHVHSLYAVPPDSHVHIGDNQWSDVEAAARLGVTAVHYLPSVAHSERLERERLFASRDTLFEHVRSACVREAAAAAERPAHHAAAFRLGVEAAPLFIGFALWIAEQAVQKKLDRLFFLTREGEFFEKVFAAVSARPVFFGHALPTGGILEVSRLATFAASMRDGSMREMSRVWDLFKAQSVIGLFATLGIEIGQFEGMLARLGLQADDVIENPQDNAALAELFKDPGFLAALERSIVEKRGLVRDYLMKQKGIGAGDRVGVVDIGWRGTIQDNLALIMPEAHFHGMYLGLRRFVNSQPANVSKAAYGPDENVDRQSGELFEVFAALEMICMSPHGSVVGYGHDDGRIICSRQPSADENLAYERFSRDFQTGVLWAAERWRLYLERYAVNAGELRACALRIWDTLRRSPGEDLAELFMRTPQHDVFGFGHFFSRSQVPSLPTILFSPFVKAKRRDLFDFVRRVQWVAAIENAGEMSWIHRRTLVLSFKMANRLKLLRMKMRHVRNKRNARL